MLIEEPTLKLEDAQNAHAHTICKDVKFVKFKGELDRAEVKLHHLEIMKFYKLAYSCVRVTRQEPMSDENLHKYRSILVGKIKTLFKLSEFSEGVSFETECCYSLLRANITEEKSH